MSKHRHMSLVVHPFATNILRRQLAPESICHAVFYFGIAIFPDCRCRVRAAAALISAAPPPIRFARITEVLLKAEQHAGRPVKAYDGINIVRPRISQRDCSP